MQVRHYDNLTVRTIDGGPSEVQQDAWEAICRAADFAMRHLELPGHLFVTVIGADVLRTGSGEGDCGFAMYHSGIQHVAVCGGDGPDELKEDRQHWINEMKISTIHEVVHYWQELQGKLDGSEENEDEADAMSREIVALVS